MITLLLGRSRLVEEEVLRLWTPLSLLVVEACCFAVATTAPPLKGILCLDFASKSRIVSLTRDLGLPVAVSLPPPLRNVGAIGGLTPGCDLALEALDDCSFPFPLERPLDLEGAPRVDTPDRVGLGLIPHPVVKLLFSLASNFFGSDIGLGILDLVMDPLRATAPPPDVPPFLDRPENGRSQQ